MSTEKGVKLELRVPAALIALFDDLIGTFYGVNRADVARFFLMKGTHDNAAAAIEVAERLKARAAARPAGLKDHRPIARTDGRYECTYCREVAHRNRENVIRHMASCDKRPIAEARDA